MFKLIFTIILACIAYANAGILAAPSAVVYTSPSEFPSASGYEYQHTVQTADYVNHASVVKPLNGFVNAPAVVRTVYNAPLTVAHAW
ncbi:unnamed protein product [Ceratitis capitata]|uniref:(Mediterranean fruit fly) hypothetical protein n=2 Tax=Ceratitis capitata TaxID=7213 RepID=A0A811V9R9_CERCA|nr:unnamed protein product [Ceratitis capitata]